MSAQVRHYDDPTGVFGDCELEQYLFEHLRTRTAQILASPDAWYCEVDTPDRIALAAAYRAGDIHEVGRIITRVAYNMAEDEAKDRLTDEYKSIRRD